MRLRNNTRISVALLLFATISPGFSMGIRSFVALPLEQGGMVFRLQDLQTFNKNKNTAIGNFAYGVRGDQTLLLGFPYRLSPAGTNRSGEVSALYRYTAWKKDFSNGTYRLGLLGGGLIPTNKTSDGAVQGGAVATFYQHRHELDLDAVWKQGIGQSPNQAQYDIAYQFRLFPAIYPGSTLGSEWDIDLEYNGRWKQNQTLNHQTTVGLQWVHPTWVLEGGIIQDINLTHDTQLIISARFHI